MKTKLISLVEDDQFFRESLARLMRSLGCNVEAFSSASEFLTSPRLQETVCLIADVNMPAMTGIELRQNLIDSGRPIPTILITAYPNEIDRARALSAGVICYLPKPIDEQDLLGCVRSALAPTS